MSLCLACRRSGSGRAAEESERERDREREREREIERERPISGSDAAWQGYVAERRVLFPEAGEGDVLPVDVTDTTCLAWARRRVEPKVRRGALPQEGRRGRVPQRIRVPGHGGRLGGVTRLGPRRRD